MLHLVGGLCVLAGSVAIGLQMVVQRKKRLEELRQFLSACRCMERELGCREPDMAELLSRLAEHTEGAVSSFFTACRQELCALGSRSFASIWREQLSHMLLRIRPQEQAQIAALGDILGQYDRESQCVALGRTAAELEAQLHRDQAEEQKQTKLYMTLSIAGGLLLVVLTC